MLGKIRGDAAPFGGIRNRLWAVLEPLTVGVHHQVRKHSVIRHPEGFFEGDATPLDAVIVLDDPLLGLVGPYVDLVLLFFGDELCLGVYALLESGDEGEKLERAARLPPALRDQVEFGAPVPVA